MKTLSNAALHRVQGQLRRADMAIDAMIRNAETRPRSWTCQEIAMLLERAAQDILDYGDVWHQGWIEERRLAGELP